jgi:hypothetical protein
MPETNIILWLQMKTKAAIEVIIVAKLYNLQLQSAIAHFT